MYQHMFPWYFAGNAKMISNHTTNSKLAGDRYIRKLMLDAHVILLQPRQ
jgi:hypothetical protein